MATDSVEKIGSTEKLLKAKKVSSKGTLEKAKAKDKVLFSPVAQRAVEKKRFVDMLIKMPEIKNTTLEKEYDYSSPQMIKELTKKLIDEGF